MPSMIVLVALMLLMLAGGGAAALVWRQHYSPQARLKKRVEAVAGVARKEGAAGREGEKGAGRRKAIQAKLKELEDEQKKKRKSEGIPERIAQAGLKMPVKQFYIYSVLFAIAAAGFYLLNGYTPIGAPFVAVAAGFAVPRWVLKYLINRRMKLFTRQFIDALDIIVRGIQTGLPVGECMNMIAREVPDPVGTEFQHIIEGQKIGLTQDEVLERSLARVPTAEFKFFAIVMNIQRQTGGNLADTLGKLSEVLRARFKLKDKIKALSSEARASAGIIGSLPFLVAGLLHLVNPNYIAQLFTDPLGHILIAGGLLWMSLGVFVMWRMINFDY